MCCAYLTTALTDAISKGDGSVLLNFAGKYNGRVPDGLHSAFLGRNPCINDTVLEFYVSGEVPKDNTDCGSKEDPPKPPPGAVLSLSSKSSRSSRKRRRRRRFPARRSSTGVR